MAKFILYVCFNLLLFTSAYAESQSETFTKVIYRKEMDLNQDRKKDKLIIEEDIEGKRNLKVLIQNSRGHWDAIVENHNMVLCRDCGGISTDDPLASVKVKRNSFEIIHKGGSRERWTSIYKFQYSPKLNTWILKKAKLNIHDTVTGYNVEKMQNIDDIDRDIGQIKLQDFNYNEFFYNLLGENLGYE